MRLLGIDYGDKTIGIAVSDEFGWTAQGIETIRRRTEDADMQRLMELKAEFGIEGVVIGLPKNMDGTIGSRGEICMQFAGQVRQILNLPVHLWDERLTTVAAERTLLAADVSRKKRKLVIDKMAAVLILQGYLDSIQKR